MNPFRIANAYEHKKSFDYEMIHALKDERGKSASFLMKGVPLSAYYGNYFFLIYDPEQLDILMATTTDASVREDYLSELEVNDRGKPIAKGNGSTDYTRHKSNREKSTDGIRNKV